MTSTVDTETLAREALQKLIAMDGLPGSVHWNNMIGELSVQVASDSDVDRWAEALGRRPDVTIGGFDHATIPGAWHVTRTYLVARKRWIGFVDLLVYCVERRVCHPAGAR